MLGLGLGLNKSGSAIQNLQTLANQGKLFLWNDAGAEELENDSGNTPTGTGESIQKWFDSSGNGYYWEQTTSSNQPTTTSRQSKLIPSFDGTDDHFLTTAPTSKWENFISQEHYVCVPLICTNATANIFAILTSEDGSFSITQRYRLYFYDGKIRMFLRTDNGSGTGEGYAIETTSTFANTFGVVSFVMRPTLSDWEIWFNDTKQGTQKVASGSPDQTLYQTNTKTSLGAQNVSGTISNFFEGETAEIVASTNMGTFDTARRELVREWS